MRYRVIGLGVIPWHGPWMNRQHLLSRLAAERPVLYSNGPPFVWDIRKGTFPLTAGHTSVDHGVVLDTSPSLPPRWPRFPRLDRMALLYNSRRWLRLLGNPELPLVALVFDPQFFPFVRYLNPSMVAYHAYDLFEGMPGWSAGLEALENALLQRADVRTASSEATCQRLAKRAGRPLAWLPNGVDVGFFDEATRAREEEPRDIAVIPHPRFGWIGSLHTGIDFGLVGELAQARPGYHFVFVGPGPAYLSDAAATEHRALMQRPNVHFLPPRSRREAVRAMLAMDVNLMLYKIEDSSWTTAGQPLKLFEYMAAGRPIASTPMPAVLPYARKGLVSIATDASEWLAILDRAVVGEAPGIAELRRRVAAANDWNARAETLDRMISEALAAHAGSAKS